MAHVDPEQEQIDQLDVVTTLVTAPILFIQKIGDEAGTRGEHSVMYWLKTKGEVVETSEGERWSDEAKEIVRYARGWFGVPRAHLAATETPAGTRWKDGLVKFRLVPA